MNESKLYINVGSTKRNQYRNRKRKKWLVLLAAMQMIYQSLWALNLDVNVDVNLDINVHVIQIHQ